jgi:hypothetical protein
MRLVAVYPEFTLRLIGVVESTKTSISAAFVRLRTILPSLLSRVLRAPRSQPKSKVRTGLPFRMDRQPQRCGLSTTALFQSFRMVDRPAAPLRSSCVALSVIRPS